MAWNLVVPRYMLETETVLEAATWASRMGKESVKEWIENWDEQEEVQESHQVGGEELEFDDEFIKPWLEQRSKEQGSMPPDESDEEAWEAYQERACFLFMESFRERGCAVNMSGVETSFPGEMKFGTQLSAAEREEAESILRRHQKVFEVDPMNWFVPPCAST